MHRSPLWFREEYESTIVQKKIILITSDNKMASLQPPQRPPRAIRTGLLMSVIRTLSTSATNEKRDLEKDKLKKEYKKSDQRLEDLIAGSHKELTLTMDTFTRITTRLASVREKVKLIRENLEACKKHLNCKHDELRNLWFDGIKNKEIINLLEQIESVKDVSEKIEEYKVKKQYLHATELLVSSVKLLEGKLARVEALREVRTELQTKKEQLQQDLIEELHKHLYVRPTADVVYIHQHGHTRDSSPFRRHGSDRSRKENTTMSTPGSSDRSTPVKRSLLEVAPSTPTHKYIQQPRALFSVSSSQLMQDSKPIQEDLKNEDPEEDSMHFIGIIIECLNKLNYIPDTVKELKDRCKTELQSVVSQASKQIADNAKVNQSSDLNINNQPYLLRDLLEVIFEQFRCISMTHECVLHNLRRIITSQNLQIHLYDKEFLWINFQSVLEELLFDYVDINNTMANQQPAYSVLTEVSTKIGDYFRKKQPINPQKVKLFKFERSFHSMSVNSYMKEQHQTTDALELEAGKKDANKLDKVFVCKPDPKNITVMFIPILSFIKEVETGLGFKEGHCTLYSAMFDYVKNIFLKKVQDEISNLDNVLNSSLAWEANADLESQKLFNRRQPLLKSTVAVDEILQKLHDLMLQIPPFSQDFLKKMKDVLNQYKTRCDSVYSDIVGQTSKEHRLISVNFATDDDISRYLRTFINWANLHCVTGRQNSEFEESPEEIHLCNLAESKKLTQVIKGPSLQEHEVLNDINKIRTLALLQESLEWLSLRIAKFAASLPGASSIELNPNLFSSPKSPVLVTYQATLPGSEEEQSLPPAVLSPLLTPALDAETVGSIMAIAEEFQDLADTCLLVLHLEVRVHCFYYLLPLASKGLFASSQGHDTPLNKQNTDITPDARIMALSKDIADIEEAVNPILQPRKFKYVFEGLGHVIASILITCVEHIKRIDSQGIKQMCKNILALQQSLTNITMSLEVALDHARQYFEMLDHSIEEILDIIVEKGPQFTKSEYTNAINLLHRSQPDSNPADWKYMKRLEEILIQFPSECHLLDLQGI